MQISRIWPKPLGSPFAGNNAERYPIINTVIDRMGSDQKMLFSGPFSDHTVFLNFLSPIRI